MNNREIAAVMWLGIALLVVLLWPEARSALWAVVKVAVHPMILGPLFAFAAWTVGLVALLHEVGLWEYDVRNDTVAWFVTVGLGLSSRSTGPRKMGSSGTRRGAPSQRLCSLRRLSTSRRSA